MVFSQAVPAKNENIPYLVTFGNKADKSWGDDDFNQIIFFSVPETQKTPFFIRIFDPNVGGKIDENRGGFNSKTKFSLYSFANQYLLLIDWFKISLINYNMSLLNRLIIDDKSCYKLININSSV